MRVLVSACLLGLATRYDGMAKPHPQVLALLSRHDLIPVCPEQLGGLPTPRPPCEIRDGRVLTREGEDETAAFVSGAQQVLQMYRLLACGAAILKQHSPSCASQRVYDGRFSGRLVSGQGICARLLAENGIRVLDENECHLLA